MQIARRVEEVRAEPVTPEVVAAAFGHRRDRNPGRVRADDRCRASSGVDFLEQRALDVELLDDGLEDPVAVLEPREVASKLAGGDQLPRVRREEGIGFQGARPLESLSRRPRR